MSTDGTTADLTELSLDEALDTLTEMSNHNHLVPKKHRRQLKQSVTKIRNAAHHRDILTLRGAIDSSALLIATAAGVEPGTLTQFTSDKSADEIHQVRNTLAAVCAATAYAHQMDPDDLIGRLQEVCIRGQKGRSLTDDEILLLRLIVCRDIQVGGGRSISAIRYLLIDSGLLPSESTVVAHQDFEFKADGSLGQMRPTSINAPGVRSRARARSVRLDPFARASLTPMLAEHLARHQHATTAPVGYTGTRPAGGHCASASASTSLARLMKRARLDANLKPLGITQWRIQKTFNKHGLEEALRLSGKASDKTLGELINQTVSWEEPEPETSGGFLDDVA